MRRFHLSPVILALLWQLAIATMCGEELTRIEQVTSLAAGKPPVPVKLSGVVIDVGPQQKSFTLHDGTHSTGVQLHGDLACPALALLCYLGH